MTSCCDFHHLANGCEQGRACPERHGQCEWSDPHDLDTLPPGGFWFAPGAIEGSSADQKPLSLGQTLAVYALLAVALTTLCAIFGFSLGLSVGWLR